MNMRRGANAGWAAGALAAVLAVSSGCGHRNGAGEAAPLPKVRTGRIVEREFLDALRVQGVVRVEQSVRMAALAPGVIEDMWVAEGQTVTNGQPLFQTDRANLERLERMRDDDVKVAAAGVREAEAAGAKSAAVLAKAKLDAGRLEKLYASDHAVTKDVWEKAEVQRQLAEADRNQAEAMADLARARAVQADSALQIARKQREDSLIRAPFDGVVTRRLLDRGDYAGAGAPVLMLDNPSRPELSILLSADRFAAVVAGRTRVRLLSGPAAGKELEVYYKASTAHPVTRTFEIRARLEPDPAWAPGMAADALVVFDRRRSPAVPAAAVAQRGGGAMVFAVVDGRVTRRAVTPGLAWEGHVELVNPGDLATLDLVIEGQTLLNDGDRVQAQNVP